MRLAIFADIHANLPALDAVLADIDRVGVDQIIINGDLVNGGPFPREVLDIVYKRELPFIRGNHEQYVINYYDNPSAFPLPQWQPVQWTCERLTQADIDFLQQTPESLVFENLLVVHGAPGWLSGGVVPGTNGKELAARYGDVGQRFLITAHTHLPFSVYWRDKLIVNTGAAGFSLDGNTAAAYVIATQCGCEWTIQHRRVPYDVTRFEAAAAERAYDVSAVAKLHVREVVTGQIHLYPYLKRLQSLGLSITDGEQEFPVEQAVPDVNYGHPSWNL
jgi:predicted phosphodiesterase